MLIPVGKHYSKVTGLTAESHSQAVKYQRFGLAKALAFEDLGMRLNNRLCFSRPVDNQRRPKAKFYEREEGLFSVDTDTARHSGSQVKSC